ncbi:discoidin domain-containing protein [Actinospica robiniae]|uniref:discoidin domain-containing protein n=1 Tax=Actinospica robiniae TaxID=304901 RepID=UPI0004252893|nr:discoidin domain-containing protein [Actinospica robiniae]
MKWKRAPRLLAAALSCLLISAVPIITSSAPASAASSNLALGKTMSSSGYNQTYAPSNANDGNQASYWESTNNAFPQWLEVDLGASTQVNQVVLQLPNGWGSRTETLSVQGSTDNTNFSTIVASTGYAFDGSANTVTINFGQTATRYLRLNFTANTGWPAGQLSEFQVYGPTTTSANLALNRSTSESSHTQTYASGNVTDGNQSTYWESNDGAFPQWVQVDLGSTVSINKVVVKLPTGWGTRTQTFSVLGSTDNSNFTTLVTSATYTFDGSANTVTINLSATTTRYVRLNFTANSVQNGGQVSELEVYGPTSGDTQAPTAPTNLAYTQPQSGSIALSWSASTDNVGVTGYDVYLNGSLITSVPGTATTYTDSEPDTLTATYFVRAHDAAGNQSGNSNSVTRTGQTGDQTAPTAPSNLAVTTPVSGTVKLTWSASTDNVGVTSYVVYRNGAVDATVSGTTLTYSESQADTATVMYYVVAKDAAGNQSQPSNTVTRTGSGGGTTGTNLAVGRPTTGSAYTYIYAPANATDNDLTTYFEGSSYPSTVTTSLLGNAQLSSVVVKLNPSSAWGARTQTIAVLGQDQSGGAFVTLAAAQSYSFDPNTGNSVTIPVSGSYQNIELSITSNSGAPGGQVAEFQVFGTPAPNPDLTVTGSSWTPNSPIETDSITTSATVANIGTAASPASSVNFYLGSTKVGSATVPALAAGATTTVSANIGTESAATYSLTAKVDEANTIVELNDSNNSYTNPTSLVVAPIQSADLVGATSWTPSNPSPGNSVAFTVALKNQGNIATSSGAHNITLTVVSSTGATVATLTGSTTGTIAAGATVNVSMGSWTSTSGNFTVKTVIAADSAEQSVKQANNTSSTTLFVGLGANMPYDNYEAEAGTVGGGAVVLSPNRTIGDLAGEASGRQAVTLGSTGSYVQWTSREATNTFVVRFSIPDATGGGGITSTLDLYVNGTLVQPLSLTSHYAWLYGAETGPGNDPSAGSPRHIYDEASFVLPATYASGSTIKLQKDAANTSTYTIDFMQLELATQTANPNPATYVTPTGFDQASVQAAFDKVRMDTTGTLVGVYLPAGQYSVTGKFEVYGKPVQVVGAGVWYTQFNAPAGQEDTDVGFDLQSGVNGSSFSGFAWFGNYDQRIDGPGKVWNLSNVSNITINNVWVEHEVVAVWGASKVSNSTFENMRIRDTYADGINLTNASTGNLITNDEARATGDDSFVLFAAEDQASGNLENNTISNVTSLFPWRAAGVAIYGGDNNTVKNFYVADTLCYSGLTVSSLNFGYPFQGFGTSPTTIQNFSLVRDGGHFWGGQVFGAVWMFSATQPFQGIRISNANISSPTYSGIMFQTDYVGGQPVNSFTDTTFTNTTITGAHQSGDAYNAKSGYGIYGNPLPESGQGPAVGSVTFTGLTESDNYIDIYNPSSPTFTITVN